MPLANVNTLDDLLSSDTNCIILSNVNAADRVLVNTAEVTELVRVVDSRKLNVEVLENVFKQFTAKLGPFNYETTQHQYAVLGMNDKKKQPVYFEYDTYTWRGTVSYHKCTEPRCDEVWTTTALKLPNDGYIYNLAFERRTKRNYTELVEEQAVKLVNILEFTRAFFGDSRVTFKFLYRAREGRCEFKVRCMEKKAWMYITFEYGTPEGVYDEGYDMDVMDRLLTTARARQTNQ